MKKSFKIYAVITHLGEKEVRQIRKLLRSPFFTTRLHIRDLFDVLVKQLHKKHRQPDPTYLYQQVYPNENYDYARIRGALSDLLELMEECLLYNALKADEITARLKLIDYYRSRKLEKSYQSVLKKTESLLQTQPKRNPAYFQNLLELTIEKSKHFEGSTRAENLYLQDISDLEDILFLSKKLRTACAKLSHQSVHKTVYDFGLLKDLLPKIEQEKYLSIPAIAIYYYCYKFLTNPNESTFFQQFKITLNKYRYQFTKDDLSDSYRLAINYCIKKNNEGDSSFIRELWELYTTGLEQGILLNNNFIPRFTFDNALTAGLRLKEFNWAKKFISEASKKLDPTYREQSIRFNLAKLAFEQQQFEAALEHLQGADFREERINIIGKILLIKIYFELEEFDALSAHLDNFSQYIRRKEVSERLGQNVLNIIRYVKKLLGIVSYSKVEKEELKKSILSETILTERDWLLEKI